MNRALFFGLLFLVAGGLFADETFESPVFSKESRLVYGNGTLSVATEVFTILVLNGNTYMKIDVPQKAFDVLQVGDVVRVTFSRGLFVNDIKALALVRRSPSAPNPAPGGGP